jgi:hypothetical protein
VFIHIGVFLSQNQQNQQKLFSCWGKLANRRLSGDGTVVPVANAFIIVLTVL